MRSKNSLLVTSSFNCASQLSSNDWISKASRSFCSGVSFSTQFALSNFGVGVAAAEGAVLAAVNTEAVVAVVEAVGLDEVSSESFGGDEETVEEAVETAAAGLAEVDGEEKKAVMEALAFGFFAVEVAMSAVLRLRGVAILLYAEEGLMYQEKGCSRRKYMGLLEGL